MDALRARKIDRALFCFALICMDAWMLRESSAAALLPGCLLDLDPHNEIKSKELSECERQNGMPSSGASSVEH